MLKGIPAWIIVLAIVLIILAILFGEPSLDGAFLHRS